MRARDIQWGDAWYWSLSFLTLISMWGGAANALSPTVIAFLTDRGIGNISLLTAALIACTFLTMISIARFTGPLRASWAELAWNTRETPSTKQLAQILAITALVAILAGTPLVVFAVNLDARPRKITSMVLSLLASPLAAVTLAAVGQRTGVSVPRWSLLRADTNVNGALMTLLTLDGSALRLAAAQRDSGHRRRLRLHSNSPRLRLFHVIASRTLRDIRTSMTLSCLAVTGTLVWVSPWLALGLALALSTGMAVSASGPWCDWVSEPRIRHGFARSGSSVPVSVLAGSALWPTVFLLISMAAIGGWCAAVYPHLLQWRLCWWLTLGLGLPLDVLAARGVAALRSAAGRGNQEVVNTLELGPIPVGLMRRLTSGWAAAGAITAAAFASPPLGAALLVLNGIIARSSHVELFHSQSAAEGPGTKKGGRGRRGRRRPSPPTA